MLWRHLLHARKNSESQRKAMETSSTLPLGFALEARMMFDGAVAATVNQAENAQPAADTTAHTATSDSKDTVHTADGTQNQTSQKQTDAADSHDNSSGTHDVAVATEAPRKEVVFIDTSVTDYQSLVDNVPAGVEVQLFDGSKDGLSQLVQWAQGHSGYDAIHILSHGGEGEVQLGTLTLDSATATARASDLAKLGAALTESGDLLLYGCEVAENSGQSFVSLLAQLTGADIAASTDMTGSSAMGGDWTLESHTGAIETAALHIDGYQHLLDVTGTDVEFVLDGITYSITPVGAGVEVFLDLNPDTSTSKWYLDIDPTTSTITMTMRDGVMAYPGLTGFQLVFSGGTLGAITSITKDNAGTTSAADISASVSSNDKTISFHINTDETTGDGVLVWHFTSSNTGQDTAPTVSATGSNPTFTENGAAVALFSGVTADTQDTGQTFTGAQLSISNVTSSTEYLTIHGVNVVLSNGNSVLLGSGYGTATVSLSSGLATITLSGAALNNADMSTLLSGITYGNSSENPNTTPRVATLTQLTDSGASNNTVAPNINSTITIVAVNDAPTDIMLSSTVLAQSLGSNGTVATLSATDVDSNSFTYSLVSGTGSTDNARFTLVGNTLRAVDASGMPAGAYSVRLRVTDDGGASYDKVVTLTVVDDIAPTFDQAPTISSPTASGFTISGSLNEAGTAYYVVVPDGASAPSATQVINGQNASGSFANASGYQLLNASPYDFNLTLAGLAASTMYDVYVVAKDSAGNNTLSVVKLDATTASSTSTAPTLNATGSNPVFIGGMAGSIDLFSGVTSSTNDAGETFRTLGLRINGVSDSGEFINVAGTNISLAANSSGSLSGIGNYSVFRSGSTAILLLNGMSASSEQINGLVDGLRYGNSSSSVTAGSREVLLTGIGDSGSAGNNSTSLSLTSSVNVLASNSALYVTSGDDTGADAGFGPTVQDDANDGGGLSLREALYWANQTPGVDRIVFQTDVTLASSIITPTETMLIDGQSFTLNGGGYSGFQITTSSITFAIQNLKLTNFTTDDNQYSGGIIGLNYNASNVNLRLYNVEISGNRDDLFGNGMIDLFNLSPGTYNFDLDRVNIHDNTLYGGLNDEGVIKLFVSGTLQTLSLSITNSSISNNVGTNPAGSTTGVAGIDLTGNQVGVSNTNHITLTNTTITGQDAGIIFGFTNNADSWVASVRNSIIAGNTVDIAVVQNYTTGTYTLNGSNNLIGGAVNFVASGDPRLSSTATNAISQGSRYYVTGDGDVRGLDSVRQGSVDIGAYASQYLAGNAPQVDLNGSNTGTDYAAGVSTDLSTGVAITDSLATVIQTDGDTRIWSMTLSLSGVLNSGSESLTLSPSALLAAHAAGINITRDGQTMTLTGGATTEAFQTVLRAIVYVNVASSPTGGARTISVTVNDDATSTATSTLNIVVGSPPVVSTPIPAQSVAQNGNLSFTVPAGTFTDPDSDPLTLSATLANGNPLPSWLTFDPATGTFSGTPGNSDVGSLSIKVTANDGNASVSTTFSLTVTDVNDAPVVATPIPIQGVLQDNPLSFTVPTGTFSDQDGDILTLNATLANGSALPTWLTFNPATNTFSGTPGNADVGSINIKIIATDPSNASVSTTFSLIVVNVNDAPEVATPVPAQTAVEGLALNFVVPPGTFSDPDGDTLTLSATLANGSALPGWLTFNSSTHTFSGTPGNSDVGSLSIRVTANDGNASVSTTFTLNVVLANNAPVVGAPVPPQSVAQDGSLSFTVPAGTFIDPDGDVLTLSATLANGSALPAWLHFDPATGTFSGTPGNADVGNISIKVTANDGDASVSTTFALTVVNVNDAPVVSGTLAPQNVAQDGSFSFTVPAGTFSDPDGDTLTLSATLADGSALPAWLTFNPATGTFSGTPGNRDVGNLSIKVTASDGSASVSTNFSLTVTNVNDAPVVGAPVPPQSIAQDGSLSFTVPAGTFVDPDGDALTLSATLADGSALPAWLTFNPATGTFSGTPGNGDVGILSIKVTASDGSESVSTNFSLTVTNVNDTPVVGAPVPAQSVAQDGSFSFTLPAGTFSDPDGDALTLNATQADGSALPAWLTFNPATGTFSGTPGNGDVGNLSIKVTATDGSASVSTNFSLTITNVNDAPVVGAPVPPQSVVQDGSFSFTVPAGTFVDPDGDVLTLSATLADGSALPAWLTFNPATGTFSGTPGNSDVGSLSIKVTASDGSASVSTNFSLTVTNVNDAPVVGAPVPPQSVAQDGSFSFTVPAGTFSDPDGDTLTLSATLVDGSPLPAWLTFNPATGTFSGTPGNSDVGNFSIKVTASDGSTSVSTSFSLTVTNVNDAPMVSGSIPAQSIAQGGSLNFTLPAGIFTDPDGDALTLNATQADGSPLPAWLTFNPATGTFSGTPGTANIGNLTILVTATDGDNTSISTTFSLSVTRASQTGGDPQFRVSDGNGPQIPGSSNAPFFGPFRGNAPGADSLFAPATLGSFTAGRAAATTSVLASVFASSRNTLDGGDASVSQTASVFNRGSAFGNGAHFDSALGSFPSFNKDPAMGGASSLASVFSGIYLPSLNTMEVFSGGSWKGITLTRESGAGESAGAFIPSLHQQLQHIGEAEGQRLSAIEQALHESGQQQG